MKRIIVTGATSMIGTALIEECIRHDIEVYAVVRAGSSKTKRLPESARIHQIECELEKLEELPAKITGECDTFFHIAWGNTAPDSPVHPTTPYGASKLAANQLSFMLCKELGMEWIWPRIFSVYGIYEKETTMIASGLRKMLKGEKTEFTPAEQRWDYLYSKDAGRAYYLIGEKGRDGAVYCVGSGQAHPLWEYIMQMAELTGADSPGIGARPYPPGAVRNLCADIESLTKDTGFVPEYTFEEGIKETLCWLESQNTGDRKK